MRAASRLADVHARRDTRRVPIERVGIRGLRHPVIVLDKAEGKQHTIAEIDMSVSLPHHFKGTHMSRFVEILSRYHREIDLRNFRHLLEEVRDRLDAESAEVEVRFPYFVEKPAPVTRAVGMVSYDCTFGGSVGKRSADFWVGVRVPVTTLCPCSKEVSDRGAHNQRGEVRLQTRYAKFFWLEDLIALVESCASAPIYSLLKRVDEKHVTEQAYDNPRFVEDLVREIAVRLQGDATFTSFDVEAENFESIHAHNAFARVAWRRPRR